MTVVARRPVVRWQPREEPAARRLPTPPAARRARDRRRLRGARVAGLVGVLLMVVSSGRLSSPIGQVPPTDWLHLVGTPDSRLLRALATLGLLTGLVLTAGACLVLWRVAARGHVTTRGVAWTVAAWSVPLVIGPPLFSLDVHSYVAQGEMVDRGLDPYRLGPEFIRGRTYDAVDPRWRAAHAPYGPLALLLSRLAVVVGGHSAVWSVVVLRAVAVLAVVALGVLVVRLAEQPAPALALAVGNPVVLVTLVSAAHHEAVVCALVVGALAAHRAGRPGTAVWLAALALADKLPGAVALGALGLLHLLSAATAGERVRVLLRDGLAVALAWVPLTLLLPTHDPLGWVRALSTPGLGRTFYAPVSLLATVTRVPESLVRALAEVASVLVVGWLLLTVRRRPLAHTVGVGLLVVGLLGPVLYPWYLAPGTVVLALAGTGWAEWLSATAGSWGLLVPLGLLRAGARRLGVGPEPEPPPVQPWTVPRPLL